MVEFYAYARVFMYMKEFYAYERVLGISRYDQ